MCVCIPGHLSLCAVDSKVLALLQTIVTAGSSVKMMMCLPFWTHMENVLKLLSVSIVKCGNIPKNHSKTILHVWSETFIPFFL